MSSSPLKLIDCDVHVCPRSADEIKAYLEQPWKHRFSIRKNTYYKNPNPPVDKMPPGGGAAGSDPDFLRSQLIDRMGIYRAIIMTQAHLTADHDPDYSSAGATPKNNRQA
ncbi:hypothetical protein K0U00_45525, partial [Paenibacillus sepulcri]|nr:hypothetical protein [Paenibacillus sepulcri]